MLAPILQWINKIYQKVNDNLDVNVSSRATDAGVWSYSTKEVTSIPSVIKSIQRGTTSTPSQNSSTNVSISSVNTSKSFVSMSTAVYAGSTGNIQGTVFAHLTSSTNLRIENQGGNALSVGGSVAWEVIEFV